MLARLAAAAPRPADGAGDPASDAALELGGNANFLITAARLGLDPAAAAHVGTDDYGAFASRELGRAGVRLVGPLVEWAGSEVAGGRAAGSSNGGSAAGRATNGAPGRRASGRPTGAAGGEPYTGDTLVCYVLVDEHAPGGPRHAFCSRYDLGPHPLHVPAGVAVVGAGPGAASQGTRPLMPGGSVPMRPRLAPGAAAALASASTAFVNGFAFDELPAGAVLDALASVRGGGGSGGRGSESLGARGSVLFDPGPRAPALAAAGTLDAALSAADVLLLTEEEAAAVTGEADPAAAARALLARHGPATGGAVGTVLIKRGPAGALLVRAGDPTVYSRPAPSITARDTVGCGDSFAAAVALARSAGVGPQVTLAIANAVGAATALAPGAGRNVAHASDAAALLRREVGDRAAEEALRLLATSLGAARARRERRGEREAAA